MLSILSLMFLLTFSPLLIIISLLFITVVLLYYSHFYCPHWAIYILLFVYIRGLIVIILIIRVTVNKERNFSFSYFFTFLFVSILIAIPISRRAYVPHYREISEGLFNLIKYPSILFFLLLLLRVLLLVISIRLKSYSSTIRSL